MSIKLVNAAFRLGLKPTDCLVLVCLAHHADETGRCYPSTSGLAERTGLSARAVQGALKRLEETPHLIIKWNGGPGGKNLFLISIEVEDTPAGDAPPPQHLRPAAAAPPQEMRETPAAAAPEPSGTVTITNVIVDAHARSSAPSASQKKAEVIELLTAVVSRDAALEFAEYRRSHKSKSLPPGGAKRLVTALSEIAGRGGDPEDALAMAMERGWASIQADWYFNSKETRDARPTPGSKPSRLEAALRVAARFDAAAGRQDHNAPQPLFPAGQKRARG